MNKIFPCRISLLPVVEVWVQVDRTCLRLDWGHHFSKLIINPFEIHVAMGEAYLVGKYVYPMDYYQRGCVKCTNYHDKNKGRKIVMPYHLHW